MYGAKTTHAIVPAVAGSASLPFTGLHVAWIIMLAMLLITAGITLRQFVRKDSGPRP